MHFFFILTILPSCYFSTAYANEKSIVVIIPSYNNKDWYTLNLGSVLNQIYHNYRVIYLNDASTDGTGSLVAQYLLEKDLDHHVTFIQNKERVGALANIYYAISQCEPSDIIVLLDGDDWLYDNLVFETLNQLYSNPNVWVTYGQYIAHPEGKGGFGAHPLPEWVFDYHAYRDFLWVTTHLRTFYAGLFQKIELKDLLHEGKFYPVAWDLAFMLPILEMAGRHSRFYPFVLYVYNLKNPLNDFKHHKDLLERLEAEIRNKARYSCIDKPY